MLALLLIALSVLPVPSDLLRDEVSLIEVNHLYGEYGKLVFTQVIFYEWSDASERYNVRDWRLAKTPDLLPRRDYARGGWLCVWVDGERVTRSVAAPAVRETLTQFDPELFARTILPADQRRKLRGE